MKSNRLRALSWSAFIAGTAVIAACSGADEAGPTASPKGDGSGAGASGNSAPEGGAGTENSGGSAPSGDGGQGGAESTPAGNDCCAEASSAGCDDGAVESCVCALDDYCCTAAWDATCVAIASSDCGACGGPMGGGAGGGAGGGGAGGGGAGGGGDAPADCSDCILDECGLGCILDGTCTTSLDVQIFTCLVFECGSECWGWTPPEGCPGSTDPCGGGCGCPGGGGSEGSCCGDNSTPGCIDDLVEACVCAQDGYCCSTEWDAQCAGEVDSFGCGQCGGASNTCCVTHSGPGCGNPDVQACVCASDPYCCSDSWDATCTAEVTSLGCGSCI
jgi:hypothetical protein